MLAFHDDPELKTFVLDQLALHRKADKLVKGTYWQAGKGCAVGCTLEAVRLHQGKGRIKHSSHELYEERLGIPRILAYLEDRIFERMPNDNSQCWPERFISAIAPGADLTLVWPRHALWMLGEELPKYAVKHPKTTAALSDVAALFREWVETGTSPARDRWLIAEDTAQVAYGVPPYADAHDPAAHAAHAAAYVPAHATLAAAYADAHAVHAVDAYATAYAAAEGGVWQKAFDDAIRRQADKLIELLEAAPRGEG